MKEVSEVVSHVVPQAPPSLSPVLKLVLQISEQPIVCFVWRKARIPLVMPLSEVMDVKAL